MTSDTRADLEPEDLDEEDDFDPLSAVEHLPEPDCRYPVIVTVEHTHVLWIEGDDQDDALRRARNHGALYELLNDQETHAGYCMDVRKPGGPHGGEWALKLDWETVNEGDYYSPYQGLECKAHVESHEYSQLVAKRAAEVAACKTAGHPALEVRDYSKDRAFCPTCGWLELAAIVTDLRAVQSTKDGDTDG
jgi:hypothetical protein